MQMDNLQRLRDLRVFLQGRKNKKIVIFGTGDYGRRTHYALAAIGFAESYYVDNHLSRGGATVWTANQGIYRIAV